MSSTVVRFPTPERSTSIPPRRRGNLDVRTREYLTPDEVELFMEGARGVGRHGHRDAALILLAYRHGLRVPELVAMRWDQVDLKAGTLHVNRLKDGSPSVQPLRSSSRQSPLLYLCFSSRNNDAPEPEQQGCGAMEKKNNHESDDGGGVQCNASSCRTA